MSSLINKKKVKEFALELGQAKFHKFTRVSGEFLIEVEGIVKDYVRRKVDGLPSVGKTIR